MLEGKSLILQPMDVADVSQEYVSWINDPATYRFLGSKFGQTMSSVRKYVESTQPPNLLCKILEKPTSVHVGNVALHHFDAIHRRMEIGIAIGAPAARGKGYGREACSLIAQFGFDHLNLHKITAGTVVENVGMVKVFQGLGFTIEATLVEHFYLEGRYLNVYRFGLLRPAFRPVGHMT